MARPSPREILARPFRASPGAADRLLGLLAAIPPTAEAASDQPGDDARRIARRAAAKAAASAGALALPPGPLGWLTIAPELYAVWKIQAQLVADIAGVHGRHGQLDREQMLHCLFSHTAAKPLQDLVIRVGQRFVVRRAPLPTLYAIVNEIAIRVAQRSAGRSVYRWVPALGALGVAGYVYADTGRVAEAAIALCSTEVIISGDGDAAVPAAKTSRRTPATSRRPKVSSADRPAADTGPRRATRAATSAAPKPASGKTGSVAAPAKTGRKRARSTPPT